jgi:hypothetical protein
MDVLSTSFAKSVDSTHFSRGGRGNNNPPDGGVEFGSTGSGIFVVVVDIVHFTNDKQKLNKVLLCRFDALIL